MKAVRKCRTSVPLDCKENKYRVTSNISINQVQSLFT
jgi:mRNA-degrading endonuclease toxin of MazEF toxin-antitoxin module